MRIGIVLGTRPEIIKNYSIVKALKSSGATVQVIYTNQHWHSRMSKIFFDELGYSYDFAMEESYSVGKAIDWVRNIIKKCQLDLILVNGDTAAALVGAIAGMYSDAKVAHVEAGLRSFDKEMYEERNRIMVDACANVLFTYTEYEREYLERNQEIRGDIHCVGNTTVDLVTDFQDRIVRPLECNYAYVTLHRKEFTDRKELMEQVFQTIAILPRRFDQVIFPVHPRTKDAMARHGLSATLLGEVTLLNPVSVFESLSFEKHAKVILTDSGTVQEEAYIFGVPCVTVRKNTERHLTVCNGANIVSGFRKDDILTAVEESLSHGKREFPAIYGSYGAGQRITNILLSDSDTSRTTLAEVFSDILNGTQMPFLVQAESATNSG